MAEGTLNARGVRRRAEIVAAARTLFSEAGFRGATMAAVATRAGVTHAGLLYHFATKEDLLDAVLEGERTRTLDLVRPVAAEGAAPAAPTDPLDRLAALVARNAADEEWTRLFSLLLGESVGLDHPVRPHMAERYDRIAEALGADLEQLSGPDAPVTRAEREGLARLLLAVMDGLQYQVLTGSSVEVEREFALAVELVRSRLTR